MIPDPRHPGFHAPSPRRAAFAIKALFESANDFVDLVANRAKDRSRRS